MRRIVLDGAAMKDATHLYAALVHALGDQNRQPGSVDAVIDIVFYEPATAAALPCEVVVAGAEERKVRAAVEELAKALADHQAWRRSDGREDLKISIRLA